MLPKVSFWNLPFHLRNGSSAYSSHYAILQKAQKEGYNHGEDFQNMRLLQSPGTEVKYKYMFYAAFSSLYSGFFATIYMRIAPFYGWKMFGLPALTSHYWFFLCPLVSAGIYGLYFWHRSYHMANYASYISSVERQRTPLENQVYIEVCNWHKKKIE